MAKVETKVLRVAAGLASGGGCWCFSLFVTDEGHVVVAESCSKNSGSVGIFVGL